MRKSEQQHLGLILLVGLFTAIGTIAYLFIRGDFKVVIIETDATLRNENVSDYINLADSQYTYDFFKEQSEENKTAVIFSSRWCGICNVIKTTVQNEFSEQATEPVTLMEADIDINTEIVNDYNVEEVPTIILIDGDEYFKYVSPNLEQIEIIVTEFLQD